MKQNTLYEGARLYEWLLNNPECAKECRNFLTVLEKNHFEYASFSDESTPDNPDLWRICSKTENRRPPENRREYETAMLELLDTLDKYSVDAVSFTKNEDGKIALFRLYEKGRHNDRL